MTDALEQARQGNKAPGAPTFDDDASISIGTITISKVQGRDAFMAYSEDEEIVAQITRPKGADGWKATILEPAGVEPREDISSSTAAKMYVFGFFDGLGFKPKA